MTASEVEKIINLENIKRINWYDEKNLRENQVGIKFENGFWVVYVTDERASIVLGSIVAFQNENEALDTFIRKARYNKKFYG
jgi:hypothetical protein